MSFPDRTNPAWPERKRLSHQVPSYVDADDYVFFLTICGEPRGKNQFAKKEAFDEIITTTRKYNESGKWWCDLLMAMPDHVHLIIHISEHAPLPQVVGVWKKAVSRYANLKWQRNFFDHRIRGADAFNQKFNYILNNPVRAELTDCEEKWPYVWRPQG